MTQKFTGIARRLQAVSRFMALAAGVFALLLMLVAVGDIVGRLALSRPIPGALELTEALLPLVVFLALAYTEGLGGHVRVVALTARLSLRKQAALDVLATGLGLLAFSLVTWKTFAFAWSSWSVQEVSMGVLPFPVYPTKFGIALGSFVLSLQFLMGLIYKTIYLITWEEKG